MTAILRTGAVALLVALLVQMAIPSQAYGVMSDDRLDDPVLEARAMGIGRQLRCVVCQNQSIEDSNAPLAEDLRRLVRERVASGESDAQVIAHIVDRYGNFVLLRPPLTPATWLLWFGPALLVLATGAVVFARTRSSAPAAAPTQPLSDDEAHRLKQLMNQGGEP